MIGVLMSSEELQKSEFKVAGKEFSVKKMNSLQAYQVFMKHVRPCFGAIKGIDLEKPEAMLEVFAAIEYQHIEAMTREFMRHCVYTRNDAGQMVKVATDPNGLMEGLSPAHLSVIVMRAFARNFGEFYSEFATEIMAIMEGMGIEPNQDQQIPSSTPASEPDSTLSLI